MAKLLAKAAHQQYAFFWEMDTGKWMETFSLVQGPGSVSSARVSCRDAGHPAQETWRLRGCKSNKEC